MKTVFQSILFSLLIAASGFSQQQYTVDNASAVTVEGTSTLHNFELTSKTVSGTILLSPNGSNLTVGKISIAIPVKGLHSGKDGMDENMYESLNADSHPTITFESSSIAAASANDSGKSELQVSGVLTINGVSKNISMNVAAKQIDGKKYSFDGSKSLRMSEYGIEPPTMFFGTVKTGDAVTIRFSVTVDNVVSASRAGL
ncbi:MAG: YceI family protein [Bacteroidota bacterium]